MSDSLYDKLRETGWRRKLTPSEEAQLRAWLADHPEARADWQVETMLSESLGRLPDAPVPTNFTARVLQAVQRESSAVRRRGWTWRWSWRSLLPKAAVAALVCGAAIFGILSSVASTKRTKLAQSVAAVSEVSSLPAPDILEDFDAIRQLNAAPRPDNELLALMQ